MKRIFSLLLILILAGACETFEVPEAEEVEDFEIKGLTLDNFPFIDCSTSTSPLRDMVMYSLLGISWKWGLDVASGSQYAVWFNLPEGMEIGSDEHKAFSDRIHELDGYSGSHGAYVNLIDGVCDVIIDSRDISRNEKEYAAEKNVTVVTKPIAWDALVFIVHPDNPVKTLTTKQIRQIYTGAIRNWKELGGENHEIHPYTRDPDSGSQEKMETLVMGGQKMKEWPEMMGNTMLSPYVSVEMDPYGIAYTPFYFCERMVRDLRNVRVLAIDGVYPTAETLLNEVRGQRNGYPFYSHIYAAVRASLHKNSHPGQIYTWLSTPKAKDIIDESGYIALRNL